MGILTHPLARAHAAAFAFEATRAKNSIFTIMSFHRTLRGEWMQNKNAVSLTPNVRCVRISIADHGRMHCIKHRASHIWWSTFISCQWNKNRKQIA